VAPTELDLHDPKGNDDHVCFAPVVREALANVAAWGFEDVFRRHHPEPGQYSFYDYRVVDSVKRGLGWRVDLLMATAPLAARSVDAWIDLAPRIGEKPSDHCPAAAEFAI
jgi:exodeoxyribonuclease-3